MRHSYRVNNITGCCILTVDYPSLLPLPSSSLSLPHNSIQNKTIILNPNKTDKNIPLGKVLINISAMNSLIVFTKGHY